MTKLYIELSNLEIDKIKSFCQCSGQDLNDFLKTTVMDKLEESILTTTNLYTSSKEEFDQVVAFSESRKNKIRENFINALEVPAPDTRGRLAGKAPKE